MFLSPQCGNQALQRENLFWNSNSFEATFNICINNVNLFTSLIVTLTTVLFVVLETFSLSVHQSCMPFLFCMQHALRHDYFPVK